jgi:hypothetical protein
MSKPAPRACHPSWRPGSSYPRLSRIVERFGVWAALWAMITMATMPTISHAIVRFSAPAGAPMVMEVCTTRGVERISMAPGLQLTDPSKDAGSKTLPASHDLNAEHCPMCGQSGHSAMPPPAQSLLKLPGLSDTPPRLFLLAPRPLFAWLQARPRGPPQIS